MPYSSFRKSTWDPVLILAQIVTLQCFGYGSFSLLVLAASLLVGIQPSPRLLFDSRLRKDTVEGWIVAAALVAMGLMNILPLVYMVERSRLCVDFALTFLAVHVILVWWNQHEFPVALLWWLAVAAFTAVMAVGGRAACLRRELLPIAIRSMMPDRPAERAGLPDEEVELAALPAQPQVLHDAPAASMPDPAPPLPNNDDDDTHSWSGSDWGSDPAQNQNQPLKKGSKND
ncbi:hypothetical protein LPJ78_002488 [Coemansia sp. RSA 989]|nr:integral membrane protein S linking to the trans Golgi network-domain-containing protein [Coemansia mojavensis]KAJ1742561.1 hypothetical protein LPJ68_001781 [Coemansia sp. RSA 1086]KAJ1751274.1 hypothetical protein LPJ79_002228 [Coemansia sp. RSA 1821]KAJ1865706.1 hypothetical protein LPJ78_002488 [Coemansia sp. RSA 989]KAJ1872908.1 hypothetical protein LPJ55_002706 [Coemansia sp. RSA 990]KAJ2627470.1 hypothetical protein H4R22_004386 [Coemansia sp. RSA 1290]KAJ2647729.1 hypothetical prot